MKEMDSDDFEHPEDNQLIVRITSSRGNNLHEVESSESDEKFLVSMPTKFRKNVWVKRGDFVIVEEIEEGDKVKGEIVRILTPQHIKEFTKDGIWPNKFSKEHLQAVNSSASGDLNRDDDTDNDDDLFINTNRNQQQLDEGDSETETDSDEEDDEDESDDGDADDQNDRDTKKP